MNARLMLACTALATAGAAPSAAAIPDGPPMGTVVWGVSGPCALAATTDPGTKTGDVLTGMLASTPVFAVGTLICTVQIGIESHAGADAASVSASGGPPVLFMAPNIVSFVSPKGVPAYLCADFTTVYGETVYWDSTTGSWSWSAGASCGSALTYDLGDVTDPVFYEVDPLLCPLIAFMLPPDGDLPYFYDCPPYH